MEYEHWCSCMEPGGRDYTAVTAFHCNNFIPDGWYFGYDRLYGKESCRTIYLTGACRNCGGIMRPGTFLPEELTGDTLIAEVYRMMRQYRPFDFKDAVGYYHGGCPERGRWYKGQDALTAQAIEQQFVPLFHLEDRSAARRWLREHPDPAWPRETKLSVGRIACRRGELKPALLEIQTEVCYG